MIYRTYEALKNAFASNEIDDDEYRKYFARMTGTSFDGYPDFSQQYFNEYLGVEKKTTKGQKKGHFVVVRSVCNSYGDPISVRDAFVFLRNRDAMAFLNSLEGDEPVVAVSTKERITRVGGDYYSYKLVQEAAK